MNLVNCAEGVTIWVEIYQGFSCNAEINQPLFHRIPTSVRYVGITSYCNMSDNQIIIHAMRCLYMCSLRADMLRSNGQR